LSSNRFNPDQPGSAPLPAELAEALAGARPHLKRVGSSVVYFPVTGSTNDVAAALAGQSAADGAVVVADAQTAGRGRFGRRWFSPPGSGLYVSIVLLPGQASADRRGRARQLLTLSAGAALAEAIETASGLRAEVKWPNDLQVGRRKLAGILAESTGSGDGDPVVLGYGINVGQMACPPDLRDRTTSLESELGRRVDRALLFAESLMALDRRYGDLLHGRFDAILDAWRARAPASIGARVMWTASGSSVGVTAGIDDEGALLVRVGDRVERVVAGEVTWL
jgi:BirA family biotin operon repressor/biotin-[acetyl-CoA-carboxylase] ligase